MKTPSLGQKGECFGTLGTFRAREDQASAIETVYSEESEPSHTSRTQNDLGAISSDRHKRLLADAVSSWKTSRKAQRHKREDSYEKTRLHRKQEMQPGVTASLRSKLKGKRIAAKKRTELKTKEECKIGSNHAQDMNFATYAM